MKRKTPVSAADRASYRAGITDAYFKGGSAREPARGTSAEEFAHWYYWTLGYTSVKLPKKLRLKPKPLFPRQLI